VSYAVSVDPTTCTSSSAVDGSATVVTFTSGTSCTWNVPAGVASVDLLVVGGGAGGYADGGGGGGGGGIRFQNGVSVSSGTQMTVTVGSGGTGGSYKLGRIPTVGGTSSLAWTGTTTYSATGGAIGSGWSAGAGGTGGTSSGPASSSSGTAGSGGNGPGACPTTGSYRFGTNGSGSFSSTITGSTVTYGGGGGGGS